MKNYSLKDPKFGTGLFEKILGGILLVILGVAIAVSLFTWLALPRMVKATERNPAFQSYNIDYSNPVDLSMFQEAVDKGALRCPGQPITLKLQGELQPASRFTQRELL